MLSVEEMKDIVSMIDYRDWVFHIEDRSAVPYLQVRFVAPDVGGFEPRWQHGRKWWLSPHMTQSEVIQTALKAVLTAEEHEARERFQYRGKRIFGPHLDVDALWGICDVVEVREEAI